MCLNLDPLYMYIQPCIFSEVKYHPPQFRPINHELIVKEEKCSLWNLYFPLLMEPWHIDNELSQMSFKIKIIINSGFHKRRYLLIKRIFQVTNDEVI